MNDELFDELIASVREGGAILRGETEAARTLAIESSQTLLRFDYEYGMSQAKFAALLGISVRTLQNWEQGRRQPQGPGPRCC